MFDLTPENATELLTLLSPLLPVLATYLTAQTTWRKEVRFGISIIATLLVALLTAYANGLLGNNFWTAFAQTFTIAQGIYWGAFKTLGLERILFPQEALVSEAAEQVKQEIAPISRETAVEILDPNKAPALNVSANVIPTPDSVV